MCGQTVGLCMHLDSLPLCACSQQSFMCADKSYWKEAAKQSVNEAVSFIFMLILALLVSLTSKTNQRCHGSISVSDHLCCIGWVLLARLPCLYNFSKC